KSRYINPELSISKQLLRKCRSIPRTLRLHIMAVFRAVCIQPVRNWENAWALRAAYKARQSGSQQEGKL
ncbi:MAG TPA: hypothetical protein PK580_07140, partial [Nitrosomonas halophila]|nr:hypothetical protein [Nitrosomonas halophila]